MFYLTPVVSFNTIPIHYRHFLKNPSNYLLRYFHLAGGIFFFTGTFSDEAIENIEKQYGVKEENDIATKTLGERLIKEMEVKGQELELQEKRMILDAIQGGVDSVLKFGFLKKKGGK